jgi:ferritin-like protein
VRKLTDLPDVATNKPFKLPADLSDVDALLRAVLDAERTSIRTLQQLYEMTRGADPVTETLVVSLLGQSVEGEQRLERLLGDEAPEMTGR